MSFKIHLQKMEKGLVLQILEQPTSIERSGFYKSINIGLKCFIFKTTNFPEITPCNLNSIPQHIIIHLRGYNEIRDYRILAINTENNEIRDDFYNLIIKAFEILNRELKD